MDETGFHIGGRTQWLHVFSTSLLTFYHVSARRGGPPHAVSGIVVHDHWKPYYTMTGVLHALCNAHRLRELKALIEIDKEEWARKMQALLQRACPRHQPCPRVWPPARGEPHRQRPTSL